MAEKLSPKERIKEITDSIEQGIKDMFNSDNYRKYLRTMSRFHNYSVNNIILIQMQCPDATHVAGFHKWKNEFGRNVRKGERGIRILAPAPVKKKIEMTKIDPHTQMPAKDENGNDITEEKEIKIPISEDRAKELAERGVAVYQLFDHGMKHRIDDPVDITVFGGLYGVTKQEWEQVRLDIPARDVERRFMERPEPVMAIYQLKETAPHELLFEAYDRLDNPPVRENYDCLYVREVHPTMPIPELLEQQFQIYNTDRPDDFTGHSLSMSDIIALKRDGEVSYHYVDTFGFREVPNFQRPENYLKAAEMAMEDDLGMIDGIINNGRSASNQTEKKPSVVEQLKSQPSSPKKTAPSKKHKEEVR